MKIGRRLLMLIIIVVILLVPLIAMQFTSEVNWTFFDFVIAGVLLLFAAALFELAFQKVKNKNWRILLGVGIIILLLVVYAELAVGLFGTVFSGD